MNEIRNNIERLRNMVYDTARKFKREPDDIVIMGATKGVPSYKIEEAIRAGINIMGENYVQEAEQKIPLVEGAMWHMVGHLQRNKVKRALKIFDTIQSVDSLSLANELSRRSSSPVRILIEIKTTKEAQKFGIHPDSVPSFFEDILKITNLEILGLMTVGPFPPSEDVSRTAFRTLRILRDRIQKSYNLYLPVLSMGMTEDFIWAIEEGATMIRIGRGIFTTRN